MAFLARRPAGLKATCLQHSFNILDTPREKDFDELAEIASEICGAPIAVVKSGRYDKAVLLGFLCLPRCLAWQNGLPIDDLE